MKKFFNKQIQASLIIALVLIALYYIPIAVVHEFLISQYFTAFITLVVGLFAYSLYLIQKADTKRINAEIIFLEIQSAVDSVKDILKTVRKGNGKLMSLPYETRLLRSSSWNKNKHLFINDFTSEEWQAVSDFYKWCELIDDSVKANNSYPEKNYDRFREQLIKKFSEYISEVFEKDLNETDKEKTQQNISVLKAKISFFDKFYTETILKYDPADPLTRIEEYIKSIDENILLSSVGNKLRSLANLER